jgi:RND family efflux transporter MFP subunit
MTVPVTINFRWVRFVVAALVLVPVACGTAERTESDEPEPALDVRTTAASMMPIAESIEAGGLVAAGLMAVLSSRVVAPIMEVRARAGSRVRSGDVLVVLDDRDLRAQARQARAAVTAAEQALGAARTEIRALDAEAALAVSWHARIVQLSEKNAATPQELDEARARLSSATATAEGARARIEYASAQIEAARASAETAEVVQSFALIRAPFDGVVTERLSDPGSLASPGAPLLRLDAAGVRTVEAQVDEARIPYVRAGDRVEVLFDAGPDPGAPRVAAGTVREIGVVSADRRAFTVTVLLAPGETARTGTFARIRFQGPSRQALVVPATAVRRQGQAATVFVVQEGVARLRLLQTGAETGEHVEVLAGLDAGEAVVDSPPPALVDGRRVSAASVAPVPVGAP